MSDAFVQQWRPSPFLPPSDARDGALTFVVTTLCLLACLTALGVMAADRAARGWTRDLRAQATVIVRPKPGETPDSAAARAVEVLAGVAGVSEARGLSRAKSEALIAPFLGNIQDLSDLPVPRLVALDLDPKHPATVHSLDSALRSQGVDAEVDDHTVWTKDITHAADIARWTGVGLFGIIAAAAAAVVAFATRAGLQARRDVVEVLHLSGATDAFIARLFQLRFARMAAISGLIGAGGAAIIGGVLRTAGGEGGLTPVLPISWMDLLAVLPCPLVAGLVAAISARITARALIADMM